MVDQSIPNIAILPADQASLSEPKSQETSPNSSSGPFNPENENKIEKTIYKLPIEEVAPINKNVNRALTLDSNYICYINQENSVTIKSIEYAFLNSTIEVPQAQILDICLYEAAEFSILGIVSSNGAIAGYRIELSDSKATIYVQQFLNHVIKEKIEKPQLLWKNANKLGLSMKNELVLLDVNSEKMFNRGKMEEADFQPKSLKVLRFDHPVKDFSFSPKYALVYLLFHNNLIQVMNIEDGVKIREFSPDADKAVNVVKVICYKNLAKQGGVNMTGQIEKGHDFSLRDVFMTVTENCEVKVWDFSEWDKTKKTYFCIERMRLNKNVENKKEKSEKNTGDVLRFRFCFFDPERSFFFLVASPENQREIKVTAFKITEFYQTYQEKYKEMKKSTKFFVSSELIPFDEEALVGVAALKLKRKDPEQELNQFNPMNPMFWRTKTQAKFNFLVRNNNFASFLSVFCPEHLESHMRTKNFLPDISAILKGLEDPIRSRSVRSLSCSLLEPRELDKILSGAQNRFGNLEEPEPLRTQTLEEIKVEEEVQSQNKGIARSFGEIMEGNQGQTKSGKKNRHRKKKHFSVVFVEPFVPKDQELEDYQNFISKESQALLEQLNKNEVPVLQDQTTDFIDELEKNMEIKQNDDTQTSDEYKEKHQSSPSTDKGYEEDVEKHSRVESTTQTSHEKDNISEESMSIDRIESLIEKRIAKKLAELKLDTLEERIQSEVEVRIHNKLAEDLEKKMAKFVETHCAGVQEKVNQSLEKERKNFSESLASQKESNTKAQESVNETFTNLTKFFNVLIQALTQSQENIQHLERKLQSKSNEFDDLIKKAQSMFQEREELHFKIHGLENQVQELEKQSRFYIQELKNAHQEPCYSPTDEATPPYQQNFPQPHIPEITDEVNISEGYKKVVQDIFRSILQMNTPKRLNQSIPNIINAHYSVSDQQFETFDHYVNNKNPPTTNIEELKKSFQDNPINLLIQKAMFPLRDNAPQQGVPTSYTELVNAETHRSGQGESLDLMDRCKSLPNLYQPLPSPNTQSFNSNPKYNFQESPTNNNNESEGYCSLPPGLAVTANKRPVLKVIKKDGRDRERGRNKEVLSEQPPFSFDFGYVNRRPTKSRLNSVHLVLPEDQAEDEVAASPTVGAQEQFENLLPKNLLQDDV